MDNNIIFLHIPKNGGTTFKNILAKCYDFEESFHITEITATENNLDEFYNMELKRKQKIKLLTGHMMYGLHKELNGKSDYVTLLRDPVERALSYYNHVVNVPHHRLHLEVTKNKWSFSDFIEKSNESDLFNLQVRLIGGVHGTKEVMLENALKNLEDNFSFIGFQEYFDESVIAFSELYNFNFTGYRSENISKKNASILLTNKKTIDFIKENNKEDYILYNRALAKFKLSLKNIPLLKLKKTKLQIRNKINNSTKVKIINNFFNDRRTYWEI